MAEEETNGDPGATTQHFARGINWERTSGSWSRDSLPASMRALVPGRSPCTSLYCAMCMRRNSSGCSDRLSFASTILATT